MKQHQQATTFEYKTLPDSVCTLIIADYTIAAAYLERLW